MKKGIWLTTLSYCFITTLTVLSLSVSASELKSIDFYQRGELSQLNFQFDEENIPFEKFHVTADKQIIIDLKNVTASNRVLRAFDTSEFSGAVVFVTAYKKPGSPNDLRVAVQLRDNVRSILNSNGKKVSLTVENRFGVFTQAQIESNKAFSEKIAGAKKENLHIPKSASLSDILENLTQSGRKRYIGKKITFNVNNIKIEDLLKFIADSSGFNIIITDEVKSSKPLTLNLTNIPWDQALDTILDLNKLVAYKNGNILMVTTLAKAIKEKESEVRAASLAKREEILVTKIFPISFAKLGDLEKILKGYSTPSRGKISQDARTNSLIIKDTVKNVEKMKKIVEALDSQTPQVLIQAKVVEVNEGYSKNFGFAKDHNLNFGYDPISTPAGNGSASLSMNAGGSGIFGLSVSSFKRLTNLNFTLNLMETENKGRVVSSPKIVTSNNTAATITNTKTQYYTASRDDQGNVTYASTDATLNLSVTPHITNQGSILMNVNVTKGDFGLQVGNEPAPKTSNSVKTDVLVDNGSTIVIGGIYTFKRDETHTGIPFLKDIPILGWLFRSEYNPVVSKSELVIFLTPRIINQDEAGLTQQL